MKKFIILAASLALFAACNNTSKPAAEPVDTDTTAVVADSTAVADTVVVDYTIKLGI